MKKIIKTSFVILSSAILLPSLISCGNTRKIDKKVIEAAKVVKENIEKLPSSDELLKGDEKSNNSLKTPLKRRTKSIAGIPENLNKEYDLLSNPSDVQYSGSWYQMYSWQNILDEQIQKANYIKEYVGRNLYSLDAWTNYFGSGLNGQAKVKMIVDEESNKITCYDYEDDGQGQLYKLVTYTNENNKAVIELSLYMNETYLDESLYEEAHASSITFVEDTYFLYESPTSVVYSDLSLDNKNLTIIKQEHRLMGSKFEPIYRISTIKRNEDNTYDAYKFTARKTYKPHAEAITYEKYNSDSILMVSGWDFDDNLRVNVNYLKGIEEAKLYYADPDVNGLLMNEFNGDLFKVSLNGTVVENYVPLDVYYKNTLDLNSHPGDISEIEGKYGYYFCMEVTGDKQGDQITYDYEFKDEALLNEINSKVNEGENAISSISFGGKEGLLSLTSAEYLSIRHSGFADRLDEEMYNTLKNEPIVDFVNGELVAE